MNTAYLPDINQSTYQLWLAWTHPDKFAQADYWLSELDDENATWAWDSGTSYINGVKYPGAVYFKNKEDYLVFKLRWPELLKFN